jgi:hypothetical protein
MGDIASTALEAVGKELAAYRWVVEEGQVNQFQRAVYVDGLELPVPGEVPVTYSVTTGLWGEPHRELLAQLGLDVDRVIHGEQRFEIDEPLQIGAEYTVRHRVADVSVKNGERAGQMVVVVIETTIEDGDGVVAVREFHTSIETER